MAPPASSPFPLVRLGNVPLSPVGAKQAMAWIESARHGPFRYIATPNVDHVVQLQENAEFRAFYDGAALSLADGVPVVWAARWLGLKGVVKVSGSDLAPALCGMAAAEGWRIFIAGGLSEGDLERDLCDIRSRFGGLDVAGHCPPMGFEDDPAETERLLAALAGADPDLVLIACGSPKSEIWMHRNAGRIARGVGISIGAGLDFLSGRARRAPRWMQRAGLEWLWRLAREPRRLARRYLRDDLRFFPLVWRWKRASRKTR